MDFIEELANVQPIENVIPNGCLSFEEEAAYVADMLVNEYNRYCVDIGRTEITFYEATGTTLVYEGEEAEKSNNKVKDFITKAVAGTKALVKNISMHIDGSVAAGKKLAKLTPEMIKSIPDDKELGVTHTFFDPSKIKFATNAIKFANKVDAVFKKSTGKSKDEIKQIVDQLYAQIPKAITGINVEMGKEAKAKVKAELIGETIKVDKKYIVKNLAKIEKVVKGDFCPAMIKSVYKEQEKLSVEVYKVINEYQYKPEYADLVPAWVDVITDIYSCTLCCYGILFDVTKRMHREYMTIVSKALKAAKVEDKKVTTESFYDAPEIPD